ncbi:hypothetical protein Trydic_g643 [Trypoxylus dichotomus]
MSHGPGKSRSASRYLLDPILTEPPQRSPTGDCVPEHSEGNRRDGARSSDSRFSARGSRGNQRGFPTKIARHSEGSIESSAQVASQPDDDLQRRASLHT